MNYDEKIFKAKANQKSRRVWLIFAILLSLNYGSDTANGLRTGKYYLIFLTLCWLPFFLGQVLLKIKGMATDLYKYEIAIGYGIFYTFVICTSPSHIAFTYILPVTSLLVLYKNRKFMIQCGIINSIIVVANAIIKFLNGMNSSNDIKEFSLQLACIILCYLCYVMSIHHLNESDGAMLNSVKSDLQRVVTTVEEVKFSSNAVVDGVTVVRELATENKHGADIVVLGMNELSNSSNTLQNKTSSSLGMTTDINTQVQNVASLIGEMVELTKESVEHAQISYGELEDVLSTTNTMSNLSNEVETILRDFKSDFEMVKTEIGVIDNISNQTNLLALNASIEAARAGEAGRGFSVVADEIRSLSTETQTSSAQIRDALTHLEDTSEKMTTSIEKTLELIQLSLEKVTQTNQSVSKITTDSSQLGEHIQVIDSAIKEVENSNTQLVDNMEQISQVVSTMTKRIMNSTETTRTMLSKYAETADNINNIEAIVEALMTELGIGGFMGIEDLNPGMKLLIKSNNSIQPAIEYHGELIESQENGLLVAFEKEIPLQKTALLTNMQITAGNILYCWDSIEITTPDKKNTATYLIRLLSRPKINNRRKYPRIDVSNFCSITPKDSDESFIGRMENISANGFAFVSDDNFFADCKGKDIVITIENFVIPEQSILEGHILRCSNNDGIYIVGCQMPEDNSDIMKYINNTLESNN